MGGWGKKLEDQWKHSSPGKKLISSKKAYVTGKKPLNLVMGDWTRKSDKRSINKNSPELNKEIQKENWKVV